jgi:hypothetical protein
MDSQLLEDLELTVDATFPNVRSLHAALLAIKSATKQVCAVSFSPDGVGVRWVHESKALQAGIFLGKGVSRGATAHAYLRTAQLSPLAPTPHAPPALRPLAQMFSSYTVAHTVKVGIPFHNLLETLAVFTSSNLAEELVIRYPGPNAELLLE